MVFYIDILNCVLWTEGLFKKP